VTPGTIMTMSLHLQKARVSIKTWSLHTTVYTLPHLYPKTWIWQN